MRGYLSVSSMDSGRIPVESRTAIYRDPGETQQILVETDDKTREIGVADATVSRKKGEDIPVVIKPKEEQIEIHNNCNSNGVTVVSEGEENEVPEGYIETVSSDAEIAIGFQTELQLTTERDAKQQVINQGDGQVVMGDNYDQSTNIGDDNVINRSDIGGEEPAEVGDDNIVNRSDVGGEPTDSPDTKTTQPVPETPDEDMQFCIHCGTEINMQATFCPSCGENLE